MFRFTVEVMHRRKDDKGPGAPLFRSVVEVLAVDETEATLVAAQLSTAIRSDHGTMPVSTKILDCTG